MFTEQIARNAIPRNLGLYFYPKEFSFKVADFYTLHKKPYSLSAVASANDDTALI